ncbi:MAG: glycoside hydrolase family 127 protein [Defluviitaleaceae bacterium]|nr:glycoside hydrolase family 127 protein [Defluviitaleaceae bacterium]MCL2273991.1 glycoside hydrolase family 127 protein [Defluviitaleaceae bacterium]MCL2274108.1 glycoside hydrolase family 127 protein [Defluviitaleaceae bacterium]
MARKNYAKPLGVKDSVIKGAFWRNFMELARTQVIPYQWEALNDRIPDAAPSHALQNFRIASGLEQGEFYGFVFQDSDVAKWLEAVAYSLATCPDAPLEKLADETIDLVVSAQQPDGYLNTYFIINGLEKRFTNLRDNHELYCLGHFIEAAVAYRQATGKDKLTKALCKYVDLVDATFGAEAGKKRGVPGHQEIELALVKLYQLTGDEKHLRLATYFINERGSRPFYFDGEHPNGSTGHTYHQSHLPVREQKVAIGHAVRALYMYAGMADVARETGDETLLSACSTLWEDVTRKQMYITGGVGATHHGEAFSFGYDLPNDTVYAETCASIALVFFAQRMFSINPKGEYMDVMERALYNGIISGMSADGKSFFYVNPLEVVPEACEKDRGKHHVKAARQKWFGCSCCPPNLARMLTSLGSYAYAKRGDTLYVNLFAGGSVDTVLDGGKIALDMETDYPHKETVTIKIREAFAGATLAVRMPAWCEGFQLTCKNIETCDIKDGYAYLRGVAEGEEISITLPMPVEMIHAHPSVRENAGKVAVQRGPVVYCLEEADNGRDLHRIFLTGDVDFATGYDADFFGGAVKIKAVGQRLSPEENDALYRKGLPQTQSEDAVLTWIPYYLWANRAVGEMTCWINYK